MTNIKKQIEFEYQKKIVRHVVFKHPFFWSDVARVNQGHDKDDFKKRIYTVSFGSGGENVDNNVACARVKAVAIMEACEMADTLNKTNGVYDDANI